MTTQKHIHFIGICGVAMSALAICWKKQGWKVTGSDAGFFPPISTHLEKNEVDFYAGWHPEKMGQPDVVVVGNVANSTNPEWLYVQKNNIPYVSYPELIAQNLVKQNSIVVAGTYGKTSSSALLAWILQQAGKDPAYMFGGLALDLAESAHNPTDSVWSVIEGDEYKTSRWDKRPKFALYSPTYLLLTAVEWDHADVYPTVDSYKNVFCELVERVPENGLMVMSKQAEGVINSVILSETKNPLHIIAQDDKRKITYGTSPSCTYRYRDIHISANGIEFTIEHNGALYMIASPLIGEYMADNICGVFALADAIGIPTETIVEAIRNFHGLHRRLEKRGIINGADVYDDIAHSPAKAASTLHSIRSLYNGKIIAIFEPNTGNRSAEAIPQYANAFCLADTVIIPRLTTVKTNLDEHKLNGAELANVIAETHPNTHHIEDDAELVTFVQKNTTSGDAVIFLGSHGFRGMIEMLLS